MEKLPPIAFAHLMKTAGQTIREILRRNFGAAHCDTLLLENVTRRDWRWIRFCYPRLRSIAGHCISPCDPLLDHYLPTARLYTFLREPVSRTISHYQFLINGGHRVPPLETWLRENANYMTRRIAGGDEAGAAIALLEKRKAFVGIMEEFDESLLLWRHWTGLPELDLRYASANRAPDNLVKESILGDPVQVGQIREANREDEKLYRHFRGSVRERQRAAYGPSLPEDLEAFRKSCRESPPKGKSTAGRWKRNLLYRTGLRSVEKDRRYT